MMHMNADETRVDVGISALSRAKAVELEDKVKAQTREVYKTSVNSFS